MLIYLIKTLLIYVEELSEIYIDQFVYGEKTAYVECLEILQLWEESATHGLNFDIEGMYPI